MDTLLNVRNKSKKDNNVINFVFSIYQGNSSVHRSALLGAVKMHKLESDENLSLRGDTLKEAIERDKIDGLIPFFVRLCLNT